MYTTQTPYETSSAQAESRPDAIEPLAAMAPSPSEPTFVGLLSGPAIQEQLQLAWERARESRKPFAVMFLRALHRGELGPAQHIIACLAELHGSARVGAHDRHALLAVLPETDAESALQIARTLAVRLSGRGRIACGVAIHPESGATLPQLVGAAERAARRACPLEPIVLAPSAQAAATATAAAAEHSLESDAGAGTRPAHEDPDLRDDRDRIATLAHEIIATVSARWFVPAPHLTDEASTLLRQHDWPGDRAELRNVIERAITLSEDETITPADLPDYIRYRAGGAPEQRQRHAAKGGALLDLRASLLDHEAMLIRQALQLSRGNQRKAAQLLNLPLRTFERKLRHLGGRERLMAS
jgi:hypothetical protein